MNFSGNSFGNGGVRTSRGAVEVLKLGVRVYVGKSQRCRSFHSVWMGDCCMILSEGVAFVINFL